MTELIGWLRVQLDEDERVAREAVRWSEGAAEWATSGEPDWEHIARHDPPRVLAEVDAKRRIVDFCADLLRPDSASTLTDPEDVDPNSWHVVRMLALPYADRPGYREEWRP